MVETASARGLVLTMFGRFLRDRDGWIAISQLTAVLEPLGVPAPSTRSAVSRLKAEGLLVADRRGGHAGYTLTDLGNRFFADGDVRIFGDDDADRAPQMVLATFSVPESDRRVRYRIRACLQGLGFGQLRSGILMAPAARMGEAGRALRREGVADLVRLWQAEHGPLGTLHDAVREAWDLDAIAASYAAVVAVADGIDLRALDDAAAFAGHVRLIDAWRSARYTDPGLHRDTVPFEWPERLARSAFQRLDAELRPRSHRHLDATMPTLDREVA